LGVTERFWLTVFGVGIIALAIFNATKIGQYPTGDPRNEPTFWVVVLGFALALAGLAIISGLRGGQRRAGRRKMGQPERDKDDR
jgi:hypothetical protein